MANWEGRNKVSGMAEYRAYMMGEDGHIRSYRAFVCDGDADAMVWAKQLLDGNDIELWSGDRFVIRFNHAGVRPPQLADIGPAPLQDGK
jgi:hypothetical protein